jgi:SAM-dependent methyltransferase
MSTTRSADETYIVNRYERLWHDWKPQYDYKHLKGGRIAEILAATGGFAPVALELGVGPGGVAAALSRRGMKVIGIDLSSDALMKAKEHCRFDQVSLMRGSGFSLPFADKALPLVYASQVLHLFDASGRQSIMAEVHRVLQPGGRFVFDMKNASSHLLRVARYSADRRKRNFPRQSEILRLLGATGFTGVSRWPGVLPVLGSARLPNLALVRALAHTTFFVATRE